MSDGESRVPAGAGNAQASIAGAIGQLHRRIGCAETYTRVTMVAVLVAVLVASGIAWSVEDRVSAVLASEVTERATDQVELGVASTIKPADLQAPTNPAKRAALAARLDGVVRRLQRDGVIRLDIIDGNGIIVYSTDPDMSGTAVPSDNPLFVDARAGVVTEATALSAGGSAAHADALLVCVPIVIDGRVAGVYAIYQDLSAFKPIRALIWMSVVGTLIPLLIALFVIGRGAALRMRRQQAERERLVQSAAEADALRTLGQQKSELLGAVSHEIRTPLSIVHGYSEILSARAAEFDAAQVREIASEINRGSTLMAHIVDDLLDFNRIERGQLRLNLLEADLSRVVRQSVEVFRQQSGYERIRFDLPDSLRATVDAVRVAQVVANLVSNALRYAPTGQIVLRLAANQCGQAMIEVQDEGPGIAPEALPHVWEMFYRAPEAKKSAINGTGIGLALVKNLVEAHGGLIDVESALNHGATFRVLLPMIPPNQNREGSPEAAPYQQSHAVTVARARRRAEALVAAADAAGSASMAENSVALAS